MTQYSKRTAIVHWLIFLLVIVALFLGHELDESKDAAQKLSLFPLHILAGDLILLLTLVRIYFRKKDGEPAPANANPLLNKIAAATHGLLNLSLIAVVIAGMATAVTSGVLEALKKSDPSLIPDFDKVAAFEYHQLFIGAVPGTAGAACRRSHLSPVHRQGQPDAPHHDQTLLTLSAPGGRYAARPCLGRHPAQTYPHHLRSAQLLAVLPARNLDAARIAFVAAALGQDRAAYSGYRTADQRHPAGLAARLLAAGTTMAGRQDRRAVAVYRHRLGRHEARQNETQPPCRLVDGAGGVLLYSERGHDAQPGALADFIGKQQ